MIFEHFLSHECIYYAFWGAILQKYAQCDIILKILNCGQFVKITGAIETYGCIMFWVVCLRMACREAQRTNDAEGTVNPPVQYLHLHHTLTALFAK